MSETVIKSRVADVYDEEAFAWKMCVCHKTQLQLFWHRCQPPFHRIYPTSETSNLTSSSTPSLEIRQQPRYHKRGDGYGDLGAVITRQSLQKNGIKASLDGDQT